MAAGLVFAFFLPSIPLWSPRWMLLVFTLSTITWKMTQSDGIHVLKPDQLADFIRSASARIVYFKRRVETSSSLAFLEEFEKAGNDLLPYKIHLGLVDCSASVSHDKYCPEDDNDERHAYGFRNGEEKMALPLDTLYDADAIVSSALHLTLIDNVPVIQQFSERRELERHCRNRCDIVFAFQRVLGTHEHRVFLEVAFLRLHRFAFVMTTSEAAVFGLRTVESDGDSSNEIEEPATWVLHCRHLNEDDVRECPHSNYRGPVEKKAMLLFLRALHLPNWVESSLEEGIESVIYFQHHLHMVFLFLDSTCAKEVRQLAPQLGLWFKGSVGVVVIDLEKVSPGALKLIGVMEERVTPPAIGFRAEGQNRTIVVMNGFDNAFQFLKDQLRNLRTSQESMGSVNGTDLFRELDELQQDDEIAKSIQPVANKALPTSMTVPSLTDETFQRDFAKQDQSTVRVVLFYLPWDSISQIALQVFEAVAHLEPSLGAVLYRVDCFDWTNVCDSETIDAYPTIRIYRKGQRPPHLYLGILHPKPFMETLNLYKNKNPVFLKTHKSIKDFTHGLYKTNRTALTLPSVVLVGGTKDFEEIMKSVGDQLHGRHLVGICKNDIGCTQVKRAFNISEPFIVVFKPSDPFQRQHILPPSATRHRNSTLISETITRVALHVFPELTDMNFVPYLKQRQQRLVGYFRLDRDDNAVFQSLGKLAVIKDFSDSLFFWMNLSKPVARNILSLLLPEKDSNVPSLIVIDYIKGLVFDFNGNSWEEDRIFEWLTAVCRGHVDATGGLQSGEWRPRLPGFDYLKFIEEDHVREAEDGIADPSLEALDELHRSRLYRFPGSSEKRRKVAVFDKPSSIGDIHVEL